MFSKLWTDYTESYYEHDCLVVNEKDVIDLELSGSSWVKCVKRWWYDLFLVSYTDERAQVYYTSAHALRMERAKQFYIYKNCVHPLSKFRKFWDSALVLIVFLNMTIFYHSTSMMYGDLNWQFYVVNVCLEIVLFLDIYINMHTGYIDKDTKRIILSSKRLMVHYASTKLFFHVLGSIPFETLMIMRYGTEINCTVCKANTFVATLELICIFRMFRLIDSTRGWSTYKRSEKMSCCLKFLRIGVIGLVSMQVLMRLADIISVLTIIYNGSLHAESYFASVLHIRYGTDSPPPSRVFFCLEFARICKSFLLFSFSMIPRAYFPDKMTSLLAYLIAMFFYMWSIVECYFFVSYLKYPQDQMYIYTDRALTLTRWRRLPDKFSDKLLKYFKFNMTRITVTEKQNGLYKSLPKCLKNEIVLSCYSKMLHRIPYFSEWPTNLIESIVLVLKEEIYLNGDVVAESSMPSDGLLIVVVGVLAIYSIKNEEMSHLIDGDYFCELCLVTDREIRMSSVVALTPCKLLFLEKITFRKLMRSYPDLFYELKETLTDKYSFRRRATVNPLPTSVE